MQIAQSSVEAYAKAQHRITASAIDAIEREIASLDFSNDAAISQSMAHLREWLPTIANIYGDAAAALASDWFDECAEAAGYPTHPDTWMPDALTYEELNGALQAGYADHMEGEEQDQVAFGGQVSADVGRRVKRQAFDETMHKAQTYPYGHCQWAWVPVGLETCAFCLTLAANGWQETTTKRAQAYRSHIHSHCDCQLMVRFSDDDSVGDYDPDTYQEQYLDAKHRAESYAEDDPVLHESLAARHKRIAHEHPTWSEKQIAQEGKRQLDAAVKKIRANSGSRGAINQLRRDMYTKQHLS